MSDLEDRIGDIADAKGIADDIVTDLEAADAGYDMLDEALKLAREAAEALATAETVETEKDFDLNLKDAWTACEALGPEDGPRFGQEGRRGDSCRAHRRCPFGTQVPGQGASGRAARGLNTALLNSELGSQKGLLPYGFAG